MDQLVSPTGLSELEVLRGLCHAFGSAADVPAALSSCLRWVQVALGGAPCSARVAVADPSGRLRVVADAGDRERGGRRRSARRRAVFLEMRSYVMQVRDGSGRGLLLLPMVSRGRAEGVLEVLCDRELLERETGTLEAIASQTAIVIRNARIRGELELQAEAQAVTADLARALVSVRSAEAALEGAVRFFYRSLRAPAAAWRSAARGAPYELIASRGIRGEMRERLWHEFLIVGRDEQTGEQSALTPEGLLEVFGKRPLVIDVGDAVIALREDERTAALSADSIGSILADVLRHADALARADMRRRGLDTAIAWTAHEFRRPLMGAKATVESLILNDSGTASFRALLDRSNRELDELGSLVDSLLRWSVGPEPLRRREVDVGRLLSQVVGGLAEGGGERVRVLAPSELLIRAEERPLGGAIENLIYNALAYSAPETEVLVSAGRNRDRIRITVEDEGPGLNPDEVAVIFDPFIRGSAGRRMKAGRGLGLFIAERVVEAHGGAIWAESKGHGAVFTIEMPVESKEAQSSVS